MKQSQQKQNLVSLPLGFSLSDGTLVSLTGTDFERHKHIIGISGSGKSSFIAAIVVYLLRLGIAFSLIDPHGDLAKLILSLLASSDFFNNPRAYDRLWYVDFNRQDGATIAFNVLKQEHIDNYKASQAFLESIHRSWPSSSGSTTALDNTITYSAFVLAENGVPITQLQRFLLDSTFRNSLLAKIKDQQIVQFFDYKFTDKVSSQLIDSTMRRLDLLTFSPSLRRALGQRENRLNFRKLMDNNTSCIINLAGLSDAEKRLAGCLVMTSLENSCLSRATMPAEKRTPYHVIVDEFPLFSASGDSFTVILEQVRKYGGTLYLAHQTTSQLSKGMAGSLQNAISILFKLGYEDSTWAAQRFVRHEEVQEPSFIDRLLGREKKQGVFDLVKNPLQAKQVFENLQRSEAILTINNQARLIRTHTIPNVQVDKMKLEEIETEYAHRLLSPLPQIEREQTASNLVLVSSAPGSVTLAKHRVPRSRTDLTPFQTFVGAAGTDEQLVSIFSQYGYLTVALVAKILGKSENAVRNKLNKLVDAKILETMNLARSSPSGRTPVVYSLKKGVRKHEFLEHALATSEILTYAALLPTLAPDLTIVDLQSDLTLKASPLKLANGNLLVPDGTVRLCSSAYEYDIYYEIDRNTEYQKEKIVTKLNNYKLLAAQCECMVVAFCAVEGGDLRVKTLRNLAVTTVPKAYRELFLFTAIDLTSLTPEMFFLSPTWLPVGESTPLPLIQL